MVSSSSGYLPLDHNNIDKINTGALPWTLFTLVFKFTIFTLRGWLPLPSSPLYPLSTLRTPHYQQKVGDLLFYFGILPLGRVGTTGSTSVGSVIMKSPSSRALSCITSKLTFALSSSSATTSQWARLIKKCTVEIKCTVTAGSHNWSNCPWVPSRSQC